MESDYDYWWWNTTKLIKYIENYQLLHADRAFDSLLKCVQNLSSAIKKFLKLFIKKY